MTILRKRVYSTVRDKEKKLAKETPTGHGMQVVEREKLHLIQDERVLHQKSLISLG